METLRPTPSTRRYFDLVNRLAIILSLSCVVRSQAREPEHAEHGMVVTVESNATDIGVAVLKSGGNAVDAAVAVGFALAVTHPSAGNLGGGGFMLIRFADGRSTFIDFRERAAAAAEPNMYLDKAGRATTDSDLGYRAVGVPGTPRGLELAERKYGAKPWQEVVRPAWQLAETGFVVSDGLARGLKANRERLGRFAQSKRIFLRNGQLYAPGEVFKQPELAGTLQRLMQRGSADFYEGETARLIASDMRTNGGLITAGDLQDYKAIERQPLVGVYRGLSVITAPPPSSGGLGILQVLGMLEHSGFEKAGAGSAAATHYMAEAMRRYFADRSRYLGDPDFFPVPTRLLLDTDYLAARARTINPQHATPSSSIFPGTVPAAEGRHTTHYSIVDAHGNAVAVTYTLNGSFGSGVTAAGTGVLLNNEMDDFSSKAGEANQSQLAYQGEANRIQPHKTPLSSMAPTIVVKESKVFAVLGSPGGPTIINTVIELLVNLIDFKMNVANAVDFPRFHHQWMPDRLQLERGYSPDVINRLKALGHQVEIVTEQGEAAVVVAKDGLLQGAADPRTEGKAKGY